MTPGDLGKLRDGARLGGLLPDMEAYVKGQETKLINEVQRKLQDGELTPDLALYAWMELVSMRKMLKSLSTKVSIGISAAERSTQFLQIGATNGQ